MLNGRGAHAQLGGELLVIGAPAQVVQTVVGSLPVQMAAFHAFWTCAHKCLKYEMVDRDVHQTGNLDEAVAISLDRTEDPRLATGMSLTIAITSDPA